MSEAGSGGRRRSGATMTGRQAPNLPDTNTHSLGVLIDCSAVDLTVKHTGIIASVLVN